MRKSLQNPSMLIVLLMAALVSGVIMTYIPVKAQEYPREQTMIMYGWDTPWQNPEHFSPFLPGDSRGNFEAIGCHDQLWTINADNGTIDMWLAENFEYAPDYRSITVNLRQGAKWSDGEPWSADDVVFTVNMLKENPLLVWASTFADVEITKINDYAVRLSWSDPNPRYHLQLAENWGVNFVPKHIWENVDPLNYTNYPPVHTGPYELVKSDLTEQVYERIEDWWGNSVFGKPAPKYIIIRVMSYESEFIEVAEHRMDAGHLAGPTDLIELKNRNQYASGWEDEPPYQWIDPCPRTIYVNHRIYPYNLVDVRKAISLVINRTKIAQVAYEGYNPYQNPVMVPLYALHSKYHQAIQDIANEYERLKYDTEEAEGLLRGLGFDRGPDNIWVTPNGTRLSVTVITRAFSPEVQRIGQVVVDSLNLFGIDAVLKPLDGATFWPKWSEKNWDIITAIMCQGWHDPYFVFEKYHSKYYVEAGNSTFGSNNDVGYRNPEFDAIVDELALLPYDMDDPEIRELYVEATELLFRDAVYLPGAQSLFTYVRDNYYWEGWSNAENSYAQGGQWTPVFSWVVLRIKSTGRLPPGLVEDPLFGQIEESIRNMYYAGIGALVIVIVIVVLFALRRHR